MFKVITSGKSTLYARKVSLTTSSPMYSGVGPNGYTPTYWTYSFNDFNEFYVLKEGEKMALPLTTARISRSFKKRAMEYFSDCNSLISKLDKKVYKEKDIKEVVIEYNNCN